MSFYLCSWYVIGNDLNHSHISKNDYQPTVFEAKLGFLGRQSAVHNYKPLSWSISTSFSVGRPIFLCDGPSYNFSASVAVFFSWVSSWIVRRTNNDHRPTIGRLFFVCRRSVDLQAVLFFLNGGRETLIDDRKSTKGHMREFISSILYFEPFRKFSKRGGLEHKGEKVSLRTISSCIGQIPWIRPFWLIIFKL